MPANELIWQSSRGTPVATSRGRFLKYFEPISRLAGAIKDNAQLRRLEFNRRLSSQQSWIGFKSAELDRASGLRVFDSDLGFVAVRK